MVRILFSSIALVLSMATTQAQAAPVLNIVGGKLAGASNVQVGGSLYDVSFVEGSCNSLFGGCDASQFAFRSEAAARLAAAALLDQVFIGVYDSQPRLTVGCVDFACIAYTPFELSSGYVRVSAAANAEANSNDFIGNDGLAVSRNTADNYYASMEVFAVWTQASNVPEPQTGALILAGLGIMAAFSRRSWMGRNPVR